MRAEQHNSFSYVSHADVGRMCPLFYFRWLFSRALLFCVSVSSIALHTIKDTENIRTCSRIHEHQDESFATTLFPPVFAENYFGCLLLGGRGRLVPLYYTLKRGTVCMPVARGDRLGAAIRIRVPVAHHTYVVVCVYTSGEMPPYGFGNATAHSLESAELSPPVERRTRHSPFILPQTTRPRTECSVLHSVSVYATCLVSRALHERAHIERTQL